jgi:NitT/TauT family transport system substrate-binding protein
MRSNRLGRASFAAAAGLAVALLAAACGSSSGSPGSATKPEQTSIVVGALPVIDDAPLYLASKNGYFKQAGLNVRIAPVTQSTLAIPDMLHGTVDIIAGANYVSFLEAQAKGAVQFKVLVEGVTCKADTFAIAALPSSGIKTPANLAGKKVAVNLTNNIQTLTANAVLKANGVDPSKVQYVVVPFPQMIAALAAHRVDAISAVQPFLTGAEVGDGAKTVVSSCTGPAANEPMSGYFATQSWAQQNPKTARAFQTAMLKAQAYANANPEAVRNILPSYIKISAQAAGHITLGSFPSTLDPGQLQQILTLMKSGGLPASSLNASSLLFH